MKTAIIFAAGRGERLRPITDKIPKSMCEINGMPLIGHHLRRLKQAGFETIIINHAYLGDAIRQYVNQSDWGLEILFSPEPPGGLETGGTVIDVLPWLKNEPFITISADIYTDYPLDELDFKQEHCAHLVLIPKLAYAPVADFGLTPSQYVTNDNRAYTFANIACFKPAMFSALTHGRFSITPWLRGLADSKQLTAEVYHGHWVDIGTPERLAQAQN